ncbi:MAG: M56 family metallopeptidase [Muribaculaceae bacterium]|nr:M56 family metallopeptidase [Muribaculaceae bacterium]
MQQFVNFLIYNVIFVSVCVLSYKIIIEKHMEPSYCRRLLTDMLWLPLLVVPMCKVVNMGYVKLYLNGNTLLVVLMIYLLGVMLGLIMSAVNFFRLNRIKKRSRQYYVGTWKVYLHNLDNLGCFSWNRCVFIPENKIESDPDELNMILAHENAHVYLFHWLDLTVVNLLLIFQWFNPFMWYLKRELQRIHECEADRKVISDNDIEQLKYEKFLIQEASRKQMGGLISNLSFSSLKYRLIMMNKKILDKNIVERSSIIIAIATAFVIMF